MFCYELKPTLFCCFTIDPKIIGFVGVIKIFLLLIYSYIANLFISVKKTTLESPKADKNYCLVLVSDIHLVSNNQNHLKKLITKIENFNATAVLISGDLIDSSSFDIEELASLKTLKAPIYFVTGNHEYYLKNQKRNWTYSKTIKY